jgi:hypothetical protein
VKENPYGDVQAALMNLRRRLGHPISTEARRPVEDAVDTPLGAVGQSEVDRSELVDDGELLAASPSGPRKSAVDVPLVPVEPL